MKNLKGRRKKAYSLVEVIVSLGVIGVVIVIFFNALVITLQISFRTIARSNVREEMSALTNQVIRDIRNADSITNCGTGGSICELVIDGNIISWEICNSDRICKTINGSERNVVYQSSSALKITRFTFEAGYIDNPTAIKNNILFTVIGSHRNESLKINNLIRQTAISTRNYEL
jgi:type II secretory pathway pseudopilin PulG